MLKKNQTYGRIENKMATLPGDGEYFLKKIMGFHPNIVQESSQRSEMVKSDGNAKWSHHCERTVWHFLIKQIYPYHLMLQLRPFYLS